MVFRYKLTHFDDIDIFLQRNTSNINQGAPADSAVLLQMTQQMVVRAAIWEGL